MIGELMVIGVASATPERLVGVGAVTVIPDEGPWTLVEKLTVHVSNVEGGDWQFVPKPLWAERLADRGCEPVPDIGARVVRDVIEGVS